MALGMEGKREEKVRTERTPTGGKVVEVGAEDDAGAVVI